MGKVITISLQKGGIGKTTVSGVTAFLLAEMGYKVLAIDFDSQGNLTSLLTRQSIYEFTGKTVLEAMKENRATDFIVEVSEKLHVLPANDYLATISRWLYREYRGVPVRLLDETLEPVRDRYDFIVIDTPPNLGDLTTNALAASDYVVIPYTTDQFTFNALFPFQETIEYVQQKVHPQLQLLGILPRVLDKRAKETNDFIEALDVHFPEKRFESVIYNNAAARRLPMKGFLQNEELGRALKDYQPYVKELLARCQSTIQM